VGVLSALNEEESKIRPGDWEPSHKTPCVGDVPSEMRCIEGGAFLLGDIHALQIAPEGDPVPERLVRITAFKLDVDELTVGTFRELVNAGKVSDANVLTVKAIPLCTYLGNKDGSNDLLPLNCMTHADAEQICKAQGKRLPTEAEWEFAAASGEEERLFPWGSDVDPCAYAIVGRARGELESAGDEGTSRSCRVPASGPLRESGVVVGGSPLDLTRAGIHNMAGNMSEWVADTHWPYASDCLGPLTGVSVDPVCTKESETSCIRGGHWRGSPSSAAAAYRDFAEPGLRLPGTGLRCAKR
jgi:sulfatase modifying factor 1